MSSSSEAAHAEARRLMQESTKSTATSQDRRNFFDNLISLCAYPSYQCKSLFGTMVFKHFAEFEDLQDRAIDAILDLCEDEQEKVRMIGIRSLGATAKADSRWVRGNTGVLLQLLECPPKERELVHQALFTLLSVSPVDVFAVMADDCKGSEEETGASRRNILDFLNHDTAEKRRAILESGDNIPAEETFRKGFESVMETTAIAETRLILGLLWPLSTVSGKNATAASANRFLRLLTDSLHPHSSPALTIPLVRITGEFLKRKPPLDSREYLRFLAKHGTTVVVMAMEKGEEVGEDLIKLLRNWAGDAVREWKRRDGESGLTEDKLVLEYSRTIVKAIIDQVKTSSKVVESSTASFETLVWSILTLMTLKDRRRDIMSSSESHSLRNVARDLTSTIKKGAQLNNRALEVTRDILEILEDYHSPLVTITPSWLPLASRPAISRPAPPGAPSGPRSGRPAPPPRAGPSASRPPPARPTTPPLSPPPTKAKEPDVPSRSQPVPPVRKTTPPRPRSTEEVAPIEASAFRSRDRNVSTIDPPKPVSRPSPPASSLLSRLTRPSSTLGLSEPRKPIELLPGPSSRQGVELFPNQPPSSSQAGTELLPGKPNGHGASGAKQAELPRSVSEPKSLADRLGSSAAGTKKRERDDADLAERLETKPSLLSRLGGRETTERETKRSRSSLPESSNAGTINGNGRSILSRLSLGSAQRDTASTNVDRSAPARTLNIRAASSAQTQTAPSAAPPSLSIVGRSSSSNQPPAGFSIKNRSAPAPAEPLPVRPQLSIRSSAGGGDDGIVRKGRGFSRTEDDGDTIMAPQPTPLGPANPGFGSAPKELRIRRPQNGGR